MMWPGGIYEYEGVTPAFAQVYCLVLNSIKFKLCNSNEGINSLHSTRISMNPYHGKKELIL